MQGQYYNQSANIIGNDILIPNAASYTEIIKRQREAMLAQLTDKSLAGPNPLDSLKPMIPPPKIYQLYKDPGVNTAPPPNYLKYT